MQKTITQSYPPTIVNSWNVEHEYTTVNVGVSSIPPPTEEENNGEEWYECLSATFRGDVTLRDILTVIDKALPMEQLTTDELTAIADITGGRDYETMVSAMVSARYSTDKMQAIINNRLLDDGNEEHEAEYNAMQAWRAEAKQIATEAMNEINGEEGTE